MHLDLNEPEGCMASILRKTLQCDASDSGGLKMSGVRLCIGMTSDVLIGRLCAHEEAQSVRNCEQSQYVSDQ